MTSVQTARQTAAPGTLCGRCGRAHKTWHALAGCRWPRACWIAGNPPADGPGYAVVSYCHPGCTVTLHATRESAEVSKGAIDRLACGGRCFRQHALLALADEKES